MKNAVNYFYNIIIDDIHQTDKMFYFDYGNYRYALIAYNGEMSALQDIYNLHLETLRHGIYVHQIILNKDGQVATLINGTPYIMMRIFYDKGDITLDKILPFMSVLSQEALGLNRTNWEILWANKIDYLEYEISQLGSNHPEIRGNFSYFVGMGETGIQLVNITLNKKNPNVKASLSHDRIRTSDTLFELYNPLNLVIDYRIRDAAEYFKHRFYDGEDIENEIYIFFRYNNLSRDEYLLFLARMLYPTYYFDIYEDIISGLDRDKELKIIISKVDDYQKLLKSIYNYYKSIMPIMPIEWLER